MTRSRSPRAVAASPLSRAAFIALVVVLSAIVTTPAYAATYVVTKTTDSNDGSCDVDCSLREAIAAANANGGPDVIVLGSGLTYTLSLGPADLPDASLPATGDLDITDSVTIDGNDSTVNAGSIDRVFDIRGLIVVAINNLTITNGIATGSLSMGGGMFIGAGATVTLSGSAVTANSTAFENGSRDAGGGIAAVGSFDAPSGIALRATLILQNTTVSNNVASNGGGIVCILCALTLSNSSVSSNTAEATDGGGIDMVGDASTLSMTSSNLTGNSAIASGSAGGGLAVPFGNGVSSLTRNRIVTNTASSASGIYNRFGVTNALTNWWGCNNGPGGTGTGCVTATNGVGGGVSTTPFLVLKLGAVPGSIQASATSTITADLTFDSTNADTSAGGTLPDGLTASFGATLGTLTAPSATTVAGKASNIFTAGATPGTASVTTTVDGQTVGASVVITPYTTTTALQGSPSSPVFVFTPVTLTATVTSVNPVAGTPSGTVTFRDGVATLAGCGSVPLNGAGIATCTIAGNTLTAGAKSFTAEFSGSSNHAPSTSLALGYTYTGCTPAPIVVNSNDSGAGSLRQALADVCPGGTITFNMASVSSPIALTSNTLTVGRDVTISGPGADLLTVRRTAGAFGIFTVQPGRTVSIAGLTIAGGIATTGVTRGGGIYNDGGTLSLADVALAENVAGAGGAVFNNGESSSASLSILNSVVAANSASQGAGIANHAAGAAATLVVRNSTVSGNSAGAHGGGIFNEGATATATFTHATIAANRTDADGDSTGSGGGLHVSAGSGPVVLHNTIVAKNVVGLSPSLTPDDVAGAIGGTTTYTLVGTSAGMVGITHGASGNLVGSPGSEIDPGLGALQLNGGATSTHALLAGSLAIDAGDNAVATSAGLTTDQRGRLRAADGPDADTTATVDLGAFESGASLSLLPDRTIAEDGSTMISIDISDPALVTSVIATSSNTTLVPNNPANLNVSGSGPTRTLTLVPVANSFGTTTISVTVSTATDTMTDSLTLTVTPVADTPSVTNAATAEDVQTTSGLVVARNAADASEVSHFKITGVAGGTLYQANGLTPIASGTFITAAQGAAGLKFTPAPNSFTAGQFSIQASLGASDAGLGGSVTSATITVSPVADTPSITNAVTIVDRQTSSGLVVTRNAVDGAEVTHFKVTALSGGTLFQNDGTTAIAVGAFITAAQASAGLRFTPAAHSTATGHVSVRASIGASDAGLGGAEATADIAISSQIITLATNGPGSPIVRRVASTTGQLISGPTGEFMAFATDVTGGVRVAEADVNGDGTPDVIAGTGPGVEPRIVIFDGASGAIIRNITAGFPGTGGVFVAAGDVDGDGSPDVIAGDGGSSAIVRVFSTASGVPVWTTVIPEPAFSGGVRVAAGDVNGDGYADIVVGSGPGRAARTRVFSGGTRTEILALDPYGAFPGGVWVAAGDVNGDGYADVITGADAGGGPHVRVFDGRTGVEHFGFFAASGTFPGGVRVAAADLTGDGKVEVITALGPGGDVVQVFDGSSGAPVGSPIAAPQAGAGTFVSAATPANRMVIDAPSSGAVVSPSFQVRGWAFEENAPGTGVDAIHVWAYPSNGAAPLFLGAASLGDSRPDVGAIFGARYSTSGYHLDVTGLADGIYDIVTFAHNSATGVFNMSRVVRARVVSPGIDVELQVDVPATGAVRPNFRVAGWAFDLGASGLGSGIEAVHVWAFPDGGGAPMFVGAATLGDDRADVAAILGPRARQSGYHLDVTGLAVGSYTLSVYAKALALPTFTVVKTVRINVTPWAPTVYMNVDIPAAGPVSGGTFAMGGWAVALDAPTTPGIVAVHVWAYPVGGGAPSFVGAATLGGNRPDIGGWFGPAYALSGWGLTVSSLPSGTWDLAVFPLVAGAPAFSAPQVVRITVP